MIIDFTQEEVDLLKILLSYLIDYLGHSPTDEELLLIASIISKLGGA